MPPNISGHILQTTANFKTEKEKGKGIKGCNPLFCHAKPKRLYVNLNFMSPCCGEVVGGLHAAWGFGFQAEGFFETDGHIG